MIRFLLPVLLVLLGSCQAPNQGASSLSTEAATEASFSLSLPQGEQSDCCAQEASAECAMKAAGVCEEGQAECPMEAAGNASCEDKVGDCQMEMEQCQEGLDATETVLGGVDATQVGMGFDALELDGSDCAMKAAADCATKAAGACEDMQSECSMEAAANAGCEDKVGDCQMKMEQCQEGMDATETILGGVEATQVGMGLEALELDGADCAMKASADCAMKAAGICEDMQGECPMEAAGNADCAMKAAMGQCSEKAAADCPHPLNATQVGLGEKECSTSECPMEATANAECSEEAALECAEKAAQCAEKAAAASALTGCCSEAPAAVETVVEEIPTATATQVGSILEIVEEEVPPCCASKSTDPSSK